MYINDSLGLLLSLLETNIDSALGAIGRGMSFKYLGEFEAKLLKASTSN
jgi:hypothetical protein